VDLRFRTKALAKRRQAEELDRLPEVAKPRGWLAALALGVMVVALLVYLLAGEIPRRLEVEGVLKSRGGVVEVQSTRSGEVTRVLVAIGDRIRPGTPIAELEDPAGRTARIEARSGGTVLGVRTAPGRVLSPGSPVLTLAAEPDERPDGAYVFVSQEDASGVAPGMPVEVSVDVAPKEAFGTVRGEVASVSGAPISPEEMALLLLNDSLVDQFSGDKAPMLVTVEFRSADTPSGLDWSSGEGPDFPLQPGALVHADIRQGDQTVLDLVLGND
jgi:multidrug resistance efflux pump